LEIPLAEDDIDTAYAYKMALEENNHHLVVVDNGERCLEIYNDRLQNIRNLTHAFADIQPFDIVILDYKMPQINGLDVAKEILAVYHRQRILLVSAYIHILVESERQYIQHNVEILQKPFTAKVLLDTIEDKAIYSELERLNIEIKTIKAAQFTHSQLLILLDFLKKYNKKQD
jgi:CheY-like chemotaxis protein